MTGWSSGSSTPESTPDWRIYVPVRRIPDLPGHRKHGCSLNYQKSQLLLHCNMAEYTDYPPDKGYSLHRFQCPVSIRFLHIPGPDSGHGCGKFHAGLRQKAQSSDTAKTAFHLSHAGHAQSDTMLLSAVIRFRYPNLKQPCLKKDAPHPARPFFYAESFFIM